MRFLRSHVAVISVSVAAIALSACAVIRPDAGSARAEVPSPAIAVSGNPAAISGADTSSAARAADIDSVVMIGDSITKGATSSLDERYELLGLQHVIEAENGKRMAVSSKGNPSGASVAEFIAGGDADHSDEVWVVALGTNDIGQYAGPEEIAAAVNEVLAVVPDDAALVWVDTYFRDRTDRAEQVNAIIHDRVERRGNSVIAPWTSFAVTDGVLSGDGIHPTTDGADVFAFVVTDTVRAFLGR